MNEARIAAGQVVESDQVLVTFRSEATASSGD
jgi:hypothetical protein